MKSLSKIEITNFINNIVEKDKLTKSFAISYFIDHAFYAEDYMPEDLWEHAVVLSSYGENILEHLHKCGIKYDTKLELFTLMRLYYHGNILIDFEKTDPQFLLDLVSKMDKSGKVFWPNIFGNKLYHKFNNSYNGDRPEILNAISSQMLLSGFQQGVFQIDNLLSGPLGFVLSIESRRLFPTLNVPLWHCSDPGCQAPHGVILEQFNSTITKCKKDMKRIIVDDYGQASEWDLYIFRINSLKKWPFGQPYKDLAYIISDCIIGDDRSKLCLRALRSKHNKSLSDILYKAKLLKGRPEEIVIMLTAEEQLQLLLTLPDKDLIDFIDELISCKEIKIPPSEVRRTRTARIGVNKEIDSEISSLGIRSNGHPPVINLASLVCNTYEKLGLTEDLFWRVRSFKGSTLRHSVIEFVRSKGPEIAVRELILPSKEVTTSIGEVLSFSIFSHEVELQVCNRLLWKLGFNLARFEDDYIILRERIFEFKECIIQLPNITDENDRASIRSIGVNLFVSVESFMEDLICYNCWLLSSDHFTGTNFSYTKKEALLSVYKILGSEIKTETASFRWCIDGNNTLGGLLCYLQELRTWIKGRLTEDKSSIFRNKNDYPHYAVDAIYIFPFNHTALWGDMPSNIINLYSETFDKIYNQLAKADLANVRNGIDHKREDDQFPDADKMLVCITRLLEGLDIADSMRLIPKLYWGKKMEVDSFGNKCTTFIDYRKQVVVIWEPSSMPVQIVYPFEVPHILAPFDLLDMPNSNIAFFISPKTSYSDFWENYPRRIELSDDLNITDILDYSYISDRSE